MKRSEFQLILKNFLKQSVQDRRLLSNEYLNSEEYYNIESELLLNEIEGAGMLPPSYFNKFDKDGKPISHYNYWEQIDGYWEDEE